MSHQNLGVIVIMCTLVVASAATLRILETVDAGKNSPNISRTSTSVEKPIPVAPDPSFFDGKDKTAAASKPVVPPNPYGVTASAYIVGNVATGEVYVKKNNTRVLPVASMSKLVTAFASTDQYPLSNIIKIPEGLASTTAPDGSNLRDGEQFTLEELLNPLLLASSNIAAEAIASSRDPAVFQELMSSYAWEVGMPQSFFADPSGISPQNVASGDDLFALARYLYKFRPDVLTITRVAMISIATTTEHGSHEIINTHPFVRDPRFIGGKTGRTPEAGETMMTILNIANQPIALIVLHSGYGMRESDTRKLLGAVGNMVR